MRSNTSDFMEDMLKDNIKQSQVDAQIQEELKRTEELEKMIDKKLEVTWKKYRDQISKMMDKSPEDENDLPVESDDEGSEDDE